MDILLKGSGDLQELQLSRWEKEKDDIEEKIRKFQKDLCDYLGEEEGNRLLVEGKRLSEEEFDTQMTKRIIRLKEISKKEKN